MDIPGLRRALDALVLAEDAHEGILFLAGSGEGDKGERLSLDEGRQGIRDGFHQDLAGPGYRTDLPADLHLHDILIHRLDGRIDRFDGPAGGLRPRKDADRQKDP